MIHAYFVVYFKMFAVSIFQNLKQYESILRLPQAYTWLLFKPVRLKNKETDCSKQYIVHAEFSNSFLRNTLFVLL